MTIAFPDQNDSEKTFEQILEFLTETIQNYQIVLKEVNGYKHECQVMRGEVAALKHENQKNEKSRKQIDQSEIEKYVSKISNMEEEILSYKKNIHAFEDAREEVEELLKNA